MELVRGIDRIQRPGQEVWHINFKKLQLYYVKQGDSMHST